jgi:hypothetical protein
MQSSSQSLVEHPAISSDRSKQLTQEKTNMPPKPSEKHVQMPTLKCQLLKLSNNAKSKIK